MLIIIPIGSELIMYPSRRVFSTQSLRNIVSCIDDLRKVFVEALELNRGVTPLEDYKQSHQNDVHLAPEYYYSLDLPALRLQVRLVGRPRYTLQSGFVARYALYYVGYLPLDDYKSTMELLEIEEDKFNKYENLYGNFLNLEEADRAFRSVAFSLFSKMEFE